MQQARSLDVEPAVQAELFETLGSLYRSLGRMTPADSLLRTALARRRAIYGPSHPAVASSLLALGELRIAQAEYDSAEALIRNGLEMAKRTLSPTDPAVGKATTDLGQVLYERGDYEKAVPVLQQAVRLQTRGDTATPGLASALTDLANTYFYLGKYALSDTLNRRALDIDKQLYGAATRSSPTSSSTSAPFDSSGRNTTRPSGTIARRSSSTKRGTGRTDIRRRHRTSPR